jgi:DNA-binding MltR family transcriptional regulator
MRRRYAVSTIGESMSNFGGKEAAETFSKYQKLISEESDRGAVILAGSILDVTLETLITSYLVPSTKKEDKLINGAYAPLGSFSAKIEMCYRLGLIRSSVLEQLQLFKKIRNDFAHRITNAQLSSEKNKAAMQEIINRVPDIENGLVECINDTFSENITAIDNKGIISRIGVRLSFDILFAMMCMSLEKVSIDIERIEPLE